MHQQVMAIAEYKYREKVLKQKEVWERESSVLEELFQNVKDMELTRRLQLQEIMEQFMQEQERILGAVDVITEATATQIAGERRTRDEMEKTIRQEVDQDLLASGISLSTSSEKFSETDLHDDVFSDPSLIESRYLSYAAVVEKVDEDDRRLAIAVVLTNRCLHLFDLEENSTIALNDPVDKALSVLIQNAVATKKSSGFKPTATFILNRCSVTLHDEAIDIKEEELSLFLNRIRLKASSEEDTKKLFMAIRGEKA